jgi:hypothetical protein
MQKSGKPHLGRKLEKYLYQEIRAAILGSITWTANLTPDFTEYNICKKVFI